MRRLAGLLIAAALGLFAPAAADPLHSSGGALLTTSPFVAATINDVTSVAPGAALGSSSSKQDQDNTPPTVNVTSWKLLNADTGNVGWTNLAVSGAAHNPAANNNCGNGGMTQSATVNFLTAQASTLLTGSGGANKNNTLILQGDSNGVTPDFGAPEAIACFLLPAADYGTTPSTNNQLLDLWGTNGSNTITQGRYLIWLTADNTWLGCCINTDRRLERLIWYVRPGHVVNVEGMWQWAYAYTDWSGIAQYLPGSSQVAGAGSLAGWANTLGWSQYDTLDAAYNRVPHSASIPDYSHGMKIASAFWEVNLFKPWNQSISGGFPYCAPHNYFSNASTANTAGGAVTTITCTGTATFSSFNWQLWNADGTLSTDFAISTSGTGAITRKTNGVLPNGSYPLMVHITDPVKHQFRNYRFDLSVGSLGAASAQCACKELLLDGSTMAMIASLDVPGAPANPHVDTTTGPHTFPLTKIPNGQTGFSFAVRWTMTAADNWIGSGSPADRYLFKFAQNAVASPVSEGPILERAITLVGGVPKGQISFTWHDEAGVPRNISSTASGCDPGVHTTANQGTWDFNSCTGQSPVSLVKWLFCTVDTGAGTPGYWCFLANDADLRANWDSGFTSTTSTTVVINPLLPKDGSTYTTNSTFFGGTGTSLSQIQNTFLSQIMPGKFARFLFWNVPIDWTAGCTFNTGKVQDCSAGTNIAALRASAGVLTDFSVASARVVGDGRSIITVAGTRGNGGFVGTATPYFGLSGNSGDFAHGWSIGTAGPSDNAAPIAEEPGNLPPASWGGQVFETFQMRNWRYPSDTTGIPKN